MRKKAIQSFIITTTAFLLSASTLFTACSAPSENINEDTLITSDDVPTTADESKGTPEPQPTENTPETKEEGSKSETTIVQSAESAEQPVTSPLTETTQTTAEAAPATTEEEPRKTDAATAPAAKPTAESTTDLTKTPKQTTRPISTPAPATANTTKTATVSSVPITETTQPTEAEPISIEPPAAKPVTESAPITVSETIPETSAASETDSSPALTGGRYNQRFCTRAELEFADKVFELTNAERIKAGLSAFEKSSALSDAARTRAWEITIDYNHNRPDGGSYSSIFDENGIEWRAIGENIAAGQESPEKVVEAWMNSPGHRANILSEDFTYLGVGYYYIKDDSENYHHYWTQNFYS